LVHAPLFVCAFSQHGDLPMPAAPLTCVLARAAAAGRRCFLAGASGPLSSSRVCLELLSSGLVVIIITGEAARREEIAQARRRSAYIWELASRGAGRASRRYWRKRGFYSKFFLFLPPIDWTPYSRRVI